LFEELVSEWIGYQGQDLSKKTSELVIAGKHNNEPWVASLVQTKR
jgi:hypothetical protein